MADTILSGLYLGDGFSARNSRLLDQLNDSKGIIINLAGGSLVNTPQNVEEIVFEIADLGPKYSDQAKMLQILEEAVPIIQRALTDKRNVLVFCSAGIQRSPTVVTAYLMAHHNLSLEDAMKHILSKRKVVFDDGHRMHFRIALENWENRQSLAERR